MVSRHNTRRTRAKNYKFAFVRDELNRLENANLYRRLSLVSKSTKPAVVLIDGIKSINLCSNDYLGLSENKTVRARTIKSLRQVSQCSSRLVAGNSSELIKLENTLADHRKTDRALIYPNGYMANIGVISTLANKSTTIFSDEYNHASIIDGCRLSGARIEIFKHNDLEHLERLVRSSESERKIFLTETIFSMDGDQSNLKRIHEIALSRNAMTIVDDSHGDFIFDHTNKLRFTSAKGVCMVDVYISSLSKALGCFGGYVAASQQITELLINRSRSFIYSSALPSHLCSSAIAAIPIANRGRLQKKLLENINFFTSNLNKIGFKTHSDKSTFRTQIIPLVIGDEKLTVQFSKNLLLNGIFIQAIRYPTVKLGFARLRASITAMLRKEQLSIAIEKIETIGKKLNII